MSPIGEKTIELVVNTFCLQKNKLIIRTVVKKIKTTHRKSFFADFYILLRL